LTAKGEKSGFRCYLLAGHFCLEVEIMVNLYFPVKLEYFLFKRESASFLGWDVGRCGDFIFKGL
jgi:hypothetical protein